MTTGTADDLGNLSKSIIQAGSKSFAAAARLFDRETRETDVWGQAQGRAGPPRQAEEDRTQNQCETQFPHSVIEPVSMLNSNGFLGVRKLKPST